MLKSSKIQILNHNPTPLRPINELGVKWDGEPIFVKNENDVGNWYFALVGELLYLPGNIGAFEELTKGSIGRLLNDGEILVLTSQHTNGAMNV